MNTILKNVSCPFQPQKFDVFLNFRGADTRKKFVSFLYKELEAQKIRTFLDGEELERGCPISSQLDQAIKESKIAIIVFSATYSASVWCLQELVKILKLQKEGLLTVVPIFYEVDPCDLRRHIGEVKKHFKKHEKRVSRETVKSWRDALTDLANISGECSKKWVDESKLVDQITEDVSKMLSSATPNNGNKLVGIDQHMNELYPQLDLNSNQDIQVIGIWGKGSMGRAALARHVYENISHNFEAHCFLQDVRSSLHCRKTYLQEELISKMQGQGLSTTMCPKAIKARVRNKKVLLVANDVDKLEQLDALAEEYTLFGPGSRIIVATKDRQLLSSWDMKSVYEPEHLRCYDVCQPLRSEAFTQRDNHVGFKRSTYRPMKFSGNNLFSTLKYLVRSTYCWNQTMKSPEAQMLYPHAKIGTRQQFYTMVKTYLQQKAKAKARRCSSQTVKMLSYP